ncbi:MAG: tripartite tricarboxylate transporter substrate binding protein [Limnohabitans sp.]|jgi:tripartite-type tricarboxylate transporter receptor subunit TctC|nr:tripartite tricarboxylate transporter substrate binding protein [Limnohabitans sp.]MDP4772558.1 tripartite tricarboxylate transporter substrate binding protein [Limnohabitans sp.]MDP4922493.1 tripartite tricarboxylate transporter substrate binding protein [Limnohabitans sp.]
MQRRNWIAAAAALLAISPFWSSTASAQAWPSRPIKLVVPFPPGGLIDNMARLIGPKLSNELGQPIVIDNKPGAGGNLGAAEAARAAADGYTLLMASPPLTISPALYSKLPYKPEQIAPVALLGRVPNVLMVHPSSGINSVAELTALAKSKPGQLNYASNGQGTSLHLSAELYKSQSGAFVTHIPYRGAAAAQTGLMATEVNMMFDNLPSALGLIKGGKLKALAVTTPMRSSALPDVPTMEEAGMKGFQVFSWFGVAAPAGLPAPILQKLEQALERVAKMPEVKAAMLKSGAEPAWANSQGLASFMQADTAKWKNVAAFANIKLD